jgi:hypothetical protein
MEGRIEGHKAHWSRGDNRFTRLDMPIQQVFFEHQVGNRRIEVIKTYDQSLAREAFGAMDDAACEELWNALHISLNYESEDLPTRDSPERRDFLWDEILDSAREDGNQSSFFVVNDSAYPGVVYVSPDWPSADLFARKLIGGAV